MTHDEAKLAAQKLAQIRQRCRTDLAYLAGIILCYGSKKAIPGMVRAYQPVFDSLQKFKGGTDFYEVKDNGNIVHKGYQPACSLWELEGKRNNLILISRSHLKTTFCTIAHSIQWLINYPNVRIKLVAAKNDQAEGFLKEIKEHFISNPKFRQIFSEYCPKFSKSGKMEDFGNTEYFTVPCRTDNSKEPSVSILSEGSVMSSTHYEVVKPDDLVDHENSKTAERVAGVNQFFDNLDPLVERSTLPEEQRAIYGYRGWLDVIGTPYNNSDVYAVIEKRNKEAVKKEWNVCKFPCWTEVAGERKAFWPERMSLSELDNTRAGMSASTFSANYLLNPVGEAQGLVKTEDELVFHPRQQLDAHRMNLREYVTIDLSSLEDMKSNRSDYTAILHGGWDRLGRLHMIDVHLKRLTDTQVFDILFDLARKNPQILYFKFQKDLISSTFMPSLQREMSLRHIWFATDWVSVSGRNKIHDRINHLEPLYRSQQIFFYDPICPSLNAEGNRLLKMRIVDEILKFPYYAHDDFLDAQSDFLMDRNLGSDDVIANHSDEVPQMEQKPFGHNETNPAMLIRERLHDRIFGFNDEPEYERSAITGF